MEKKKSSPFIIPASTFASIIKEVTETLDVPLEEKEATKNIEEEKEEISKPNLLTTTKRKTSALSLKSILQKEEIKNIEVEAEKIDLPSDKFSQEKFIIYWNEYIEKLLDKGEKSVASILQTTMPKVSKNTIKLELPNHVMRNQLNKFEHELLKFVREKLNNYQINLSLKVNETFTQRKAYTPEEKFQKLKEKNTTLTKFISTFKLDF